MPVSSVTGGGSHFRESPQFAASIRIEKIELPFAIAPDLHIQFLVVVLAALRD
jgi:hypothetical protein